MAAADAIVIQTKRRKKNRENITYPAAYVENPETKKRILVASIQEPVWIGSVELFLLRRAFQKSYDPLPVDSESILNFVEQESDSLTLLLPYNPPSEPTILLQDENGNCKYVLWISWRIALQLFDSLTNWPSILPSME